MVAQIDKQYSKLGASKVIRRITSYAMFEGRPHSTAGQWFNPVVFAVLKTLKALPGNPIVREPIFITGLGRSGTTILGLLLSIHKDVGFLNEPKAPWALINHQSDICGDYVRSGGVFRLTAEDTSAQQIKDSHKIFSRYLTLLGAKRVVDKYPESIFRIDYLKAIFPDAKFIFLSRNGPDAVSSINLWSQRLGIKKNNSTEDWWGRDDIKWTYLREHIISEASEHNRLERLASLATPELDHINRAAIEWIVSMREGLRAVEREPTAVHRLNYEDLVRHPIPQLEQLLEFCNLEDDPALFDYAKTALYKTPPHPIPRLIPAIADEFSATMAALGYPT